MSLLFWWAIRRISWIRGENPPLPPPFHCIHHVKFLLRFSIFMF